MEDHNDRRLLAAVRASDVGAFRLVFEKYQPALFRAILARVRDEPLAHDIVQETFARVWEHRAKIQPRLPFFAYIFRIATNLLKDQARHTQARARLGGEAENALYPRAPLTDEQYEARELEEKIRTIVDTELGERCRMVFLLSRAGGKTNREIAAMLNLRLKTVENQITHALKILRRKLGGG